MQEKLPTRLELNERIQRLKSYAIKMALLVMMPGLLILMWANIALSPPGEALSGRRLCVFSILVAGFILIVGFTMARKSVFARFGLICPHCGKSILGRAPDPMNRRPERVLATGQCAVCGKKIVSD